MTACAPPAAATVQVCMPFVVRSSLVEVLLGCTPATWPKEVTWQPEMEHWEAGAQLNSILKILAKILTKSNLKRRHVQTPISWLFIVTFWLEVHEDFQDAIELGPSFLLVTCRVLPTLISDFQCRCHFRTEMQLAAPFGESVSRSLTLVNGNGLLSWLRVTFHKFQKTLSFTKLFSQVSNTQNFNV